jgi:coenzyme F420-reducing hydrogenase delta subunit
MKNLLEHVGIEPGRLQFSWISSSEAPKFVDVANKVVTEVQTLGPTRHLIKKRERVA